VEELCQPIISSRGQWTRRREEYCWTAEVMDWLYERGGRFSLERCGLLSDFREGRQAGIWFRDVKRVTLFKLTFGGQQPPRSHYMRQSPHQYWSLGSLSISPLGKV
jgi:hypothetical protein